MERRKWLINSGVTNQMIEECFWCNDNPELFEKEIDFQLDCRFWNNG